MTLVGAFKATVHSYVEILTDLTLCRVILRGVLPGYIQWEMAGDKEFHNIRWSVTLSDVILSGFDCSPFVDSP